MTSVGALSSRNALSAPRSSIPSRTSFTVIFIFSPSRNDNGLSINNPDDEIGPSTVTPFTSFRASSERSEGSVALGREMLRCAQHDSSVAFPISQSKKLICIIHKEILVDSCFSVLGFTQEGVMALEVFISYSHQDQALRKNWKST